MTEIARSTLSVPTRSARTAVAEIFSGSAADEIRQKLEEGFALHVNGLLWVRGSMSMSCSEEMRRTIFGSPTFKVSVVRMPNGDIEFSLKSTLRAPRTEA